MYLNTCTKQTHNHQYKNEGPRQSQQRRWWWIFKLIAIFPRLGGSMVAMIGVDDVDELMSMVSGAALGFLFRGVKKKHKFQYYR